MSSDISGVVRHFILENFVMDPDAKLGDDESFLEHRTIDSTGFIELITFLEERFGIVIEDQEMIPENLDSLRAITRFIEGKRIGPEAQACAS